MGVLRFGGIKQRDTGQSGRGKIGTHNPLSWPLTPHSETYLYCGPGKGMDGAHGPRCLAGGMAGQLVSPASSEKVLRDRALEEGRAGAGLPAGYPRH